MRLLRYTLIEAARSVWRRRGSAALAALAATLVILVLGAFLLVTVNRARIIAEWRSAGEFSVYLRDDVSADERGTIEAAIESSGIAAQREYVSKAQALTRFRREYADLSPIVDDFDDNPFPASFEVQVDPAATRDGRARDVIRRIGGLPGVADVRYDGDWLQRLSGVVTTVSGIGLALTVVLALAAALTVASIVRLGLQDRRDELEIMQLAGAPLAYIRGPVIAEGMLQGAIGAAAALVILWMGFAAAQWRWGSAIAAMLNGETALFLSPLTSALLFAGGVILGAVGGAVASRHAA
jgi:cell division transport system permease protein